MPDTTPAPADELRAAAEKLRKLIAAATPGPWTAMPDVLVGGWAVAHDPKSDEGPYPADFIHEPDARYIAAMHPGVGLPLADWLDTEAATWAGDEVHNQCSSKTCTLDAALAVARAVLADEGA
jgi:hypothetical protein